MPFTAGSKNLGIMAFSQVAVSFSHKTGSLGTSRPGLVWWLWYATDVPSSHQPLFLKPRYMANLSPTVQAGRRRGMRKGRGSSYIRRGKTSPEWTGFLVYLWPERYHVATPSCRVSQELLTSWAGYFPKQNEGSVGKEGKGGVCSSQ